MRTRLRSWWAPRPPEPGRCRRVRRALTGALMTGVWLALMALPATPAHAAPGHEKHPGVESVMKNIMCTCGCSLTVSACEAVMTCEVAAKMKTDIAEKIESGMTVKQVLAGFEADYGEQILAAPTKKGFNLTAWIIPILALVSGAGTVIVALRKWGPSSSDEPPDEDALDPELRSRIEEEVARGF